MSNKTLDRHSILRKTIQVGWATFASRLLGLIRETLLGRYLGATALADVFITSFKIPNSLRKIFAEGALSASFVPVFVKLYQKENGKKAVNSLMSLAFLVFEGALIALCVLIFWRADAVIRFIATGWYSYKLPSTPDGFGGFLLRSYYWLSMIVNPQKFNMVPGPQVAHAIIYLRILIGFIVFISSSALLSGALQSVNHFFVPAISPVLVNVVFISGIAVSLYFGLSIEYLCLFILFAGLAQFLLHVATYFKLRFKFGPINELAWKNLRFVLRKFFPCVLSMSVMEINLFIDTSLASYLSSGSMLIIYLANRFMGIPLGVFAVAFSTILLPHFSRVSMQNPRRLSFYLFESTKFIFWITVPVALFMCFWADNIFYTLFLSEKFPLAKVIEASYVLMAFLLGLFFFSLNKVLLSLYYALHETWVPTVISIVATLINFAVNLLWLDVFQATGLALATTVSGMAQTVLFLFFLRRKFDFCLYIDRLLQFMGRYLVQLFCIGLLFYVSYYGIVNLIKLLPERVSNFCFLTVGYWLWSLPLAAGSMFALYLTRRWFGVRLYFLD